MLLNNIENETNEINIIYEINVNNCQLIHVMLEKFINTTTENNTIVVNNLRENDLYNIILLIIDVHANSKVIFNKSNEINKIKIETINTTNINRCIIALNGLLCKFHNLINDISSNDDDYAGCGLDNLNSICV